MLVDGAVDVAPDAGDLDLGLVNKPTVTDHVARWLCRLDEQRREALHPPVQGDVVDFDSAFGEELSRSRYDRPNRRYQRTANKITSGGNRKPANADNSDSSGAT